MVFDCGACIAKYLLCCFNFIIFIAGSVILGVGIWLAVDKSSFIALTKVVPSEHLEQFTQPKVIDQASYILIVAGAFMFIVSFLGYCGAIRESQHLLTAYGICLVLILILEITAGGLAAAYKGTAEEETRTFLKSSIKKYYTTGNQTDAFSLLWNHIQAQLSCCGVDDYKDFEDAINWDKNKVIPESCCVLSDASTFKPKFPICTTRPDELNSYRFKGCLKAALEWIMSHMNIVIGVGIGLGVVQLLGIFLAFCLCKSIDGYIK